LDLTLTSVLKKGVYIVTTPAAYIEFPVSPDIEGFWQWDKMHCPRPQTPLTEEAFLSAISEGFSKAMNEWACPVGIGYRSINYYSFLSTPPFDLGTESTEERVARHQRIMGEVLPRLGELWQQEWLPSILPGIEKARNTDYATLTDTGLFETLAEMRRAFVDRYVVHGRINFVTMSASQFADFYNESFDPEDPTEPYLLLQGFPTRSLDAGRGLWKLSRTIKNNRKLKSLFENLETSQLIPQLEASAEGANFLREFRTYLDEFGWRSDAFEMADPTWRENPIIPLNTLQGYIYLDDAADPDARFKEAVQTRQRLLGEARQRLAQDPEKLSRFNQLYEIARPYLTLTEDHNYYIDQIGNAVMRLPFLELGRRLVRRGVLSNENDIFWLYLAEIQDGLSGANQQSRVAQRKSEMEKWSRIVPPPTIGEPPPPNNDPFAAAHGKMFGVPPEPSRDPDVITGIGASPGTVQGRAKVVRNLAEASKIQPGDILVCEMTMPPWTPLFSTVSAVVADTGGVLSHCAIVAREYRMPCVVGTILGTSAIKDGMLLTVDGSKGIVRIDSRA
jgi:rifampicin phosphotransferase